MDNTIFSLTSGACATAVGELTLTTGLGDSTACLPVLECDPWASRLAAARYLGGLRLRHWTTGHH